MSADLLDDRCPFYWWAQGPERGLCNENWPILWAPRADRVRLNRYVGESALVWPVRSGELERLPANAGEGEV